MKTNIGLKWRHICRFGVMALLLGLSQGVEARSWLSGRTINGQRIPESAMVYYDGMSAEKSTGTAPVDFDLTVSTYRRQITPEVKAYYEAVMMHFADAVWQMTQGGHRIKNVTFYYDTNSNVNVKVMRYGTAQAWVRDYINLYEGPVKSLEDEPETKIPVGVFYPDILGYILAHEYAHFKYGLLDEYVPNKHLSNAQHIAQIKDFPVGPSIMNSPYNTLFFTTDEGCDICLIATCDDCPYTPDLYSLLNPRQEQFAETRIASTAHPTNLQYQNDVRLALEGSAAVDRDYYRGFGWLNFSLPNEKGARSFRPGPYQNTMNTAQHRVYGMSGWETLLTDKRSWDSHYWRSNRNFFPELSQHAPIQRWKATITKGVGYFRPAQGANPQTIKGLHRGKFSVESPRRFPQTGTIIVWFYRNGDLDATDSVEFDFDLQNNFRGSFYMSVNGTFSVKDEGGGNYSINPEGETYERLSSLIPGESILAREVLNIDWSNMSLTQPGTATQVFQIVIDKSGSMDNAMMAQARTAAKLLVDRASLNADYVGVLAFNERVHEVVPLTFIDAEETRESVKASIDGIRAEGWTAIGDAARLALQRLTESDVSGTKVVFLLSDGLSNRGINPLQVIPDYQNARVPLFTFGFGSGADENTLKRLAEETGGHYFFSPTTLTDIQSAFDLAFTLSGDMHTITAGSETVNPNKGVVVPLSTFVVDSTLGARLDVSVTGTVPTGQAQVRLVAPSSDAYEPKVVSSVGNETLFFFSIASPEPGRWTIEVETQLSATFSYIASGMPDKASYAVRLEVDSQILYPEPLLVRVMIDKDYPITGIQPTGILTAPDGTANEFTLTDLLGIGEYSASLPYIQNGLHTVSLHFDNREGTALYTTAGSASARDNMLVPVNEDFDRYAEAQVRTFGWRNDDHGNTFATATAAIADNEPVLGRIDYPGDIDMFAVDVPIGCDELLFRVWGIPTGERLVLSLYGQSGESILVSAESIGMDVQDLVVLRFPVDSEDWESTLYAEVRHPDPLAHGYSYAFSVGVELPTEKIVRVETPNLLGMTREEAKQELDDYGLALGPVTEQHSNIVEAGLVLSQRPRAGVIVDPGDTIYFTLSLGPQTLQAVTVPYIVGMTEPAARAALTAAGLTAGAITFAYHDHIDANKIVLQNPAGGTRVEPGASVDVVVSLGPESKGCMNCGAGGTAKGVKGDLLLLALVSIFVVGAERRHRRPSL